MDIKSVLAGEIIAPKAKKSDTRVQRQRTINAAATFLSGQLSEQQSPVKDRATKRRYQSLPLIPDKSDHSGQIKELNPMVRQGQKVMTAERPLHRHTGDDHPEIWTRCEGHIIWGKRLELQSQRSRIEQYSWT